MNDRQMNFYIDKQRHDDKCGAEADDREYTTEGYEPDEKECIRWDIECKAKYGDFIDMDHIDDVVGTLKYTKTEAMAIYLNWLGFKVSHYEDDGQAGVVYTNDGIKVSSTGYATTYQRGK